MATKKTGATPWVDPDDAPELTPAFFADAEIFAADRFVRRGRPKSAHTKEQINLRLDPDILAALRAAGPGWQTRINTILRTALGLVAERKST